MSQRWYLPVDVWLGEGALQAVCEALQGRSCVVLALEPAGPLGWRDTWQQVLGRSLQAWVPLPEGLATLALARQVSAELWPLLAVDPAPVLVALGGGSVMDIAKLLRCRPEPADFEALAAALRKQQPWPVLKHSSLWLVPTTAATGSEVTRWATVWDTDAEPGHGVARKLSFDEPFGWADRAFVDPLLSATAPLLIMRDGALDALSHALEALWNRHANPVSDQLALAAAQQLLQTLPQAVRSPADAAHRRALSQAALMAGLAFSQTRTALAHALSYAVTLEQGLPHGLACAIWLPQVSRLAIGVEARVDAHLAQLFGCRPGEVPSRLEAWLLDCGVEASPQTHGVHDAERRISAALRSERGRNFIGSVLT